MGSVKMSSTMFVLRLAGTLAMGLGGIVLVGLSFNITALGHILPGWTFVKPNAALAFFLSGIALFFYLSSSVTLVRVARLCGCLSGLIGVLTLTEYVTGWNSGLEQWLVRESAGTVVDWLRVRMAPDTALCFVLLAVGLELSRFARRRWMVIASAVLGVLVTALALVNVMSYFTPNLRTYAWGAVPMMAFLTAVMFALLGLALIWAVSRERLPGLTSPLTPLWFSMLLLAFLLLAVAIISAGIFYYRNYSKSCRMEVERDLSAVVALKADQLEQWRKERKGDADFLFQNGPVSALIRRFLEKPEDRDAEREIKLWMGKYLKSYGYDGVQLLDTQGVTRISSPFGLPAVSSLSAEELSGVLRAGQPVFKDFYRDTCDHRVYLGILVPILDERDASQRLGVLFLRINPETYIYPSLKFWPRPSRTAETVLVRRQGHEVVVLNELRAHTNAALNLTLSLGRIEFSEGQAALEREGVWESVNNRGEPVVSALRPIPDSPWSLVVRMDIAETYRDRLWQFIVTAGALLLGAGSCVVLIWWRYRSRLFKEQLRAEEELRASTAKYHRPYESMTDAFVVVDMEGRIQEYNPSYQSMLGYSDTELRQLTYRDLTPEKWHAFESEIIAKQIMPNGFSGVYEKEYRRRDGTIFPVELRTFLIRDDAGKPSGLWAIVRDITERHRAEEALRKSESLLQATGKMACVGGWEFDVQSMNLVWTREVCRIHEVDPDYTPSVQAAIDFYAPEARPVISQAVQRAIEKGESFDLELQIITAKGNRRWVHAIGEARERNGKVEAVFGTFQDITERKRVEDEKARLEAQLQQAQKMESEGRLAGGVAHDFNNMLGVILGYTEIALMKVEPGQELYADLEEIRKAAQRSANLTRQLLAFARKQVVQPKILDLNETVTGMLKMLQRLIGENIRLNWRPQDGLWLIRMDPSQIDQILANLFVNARSAIADVGAITIETGNVALDAGSSSDFMGIASGEYVVLTVSDDGCGMDEDTQANLFEPFFTTKGVGEGTGLGLATVYGIIKQNGGFINVSSEPGKGATFTIYLPRHNEAAKEIQAEVPVKPVVAGHETILLVEDEPSMLRMTARMLEQQGYTVLAAGSPGEAVRLAVEHATRISLIVTDVVMPDMNGLELAQKLQAIYPHLRCLFMSGYAADAIARLGVADKAVNFIQKPFVAPDLAVKVRQLLDAKGT